MRRLPPLPSIRIFEAAARHGNFTRAGEELGMTQAAVSYQIKLLEARLGYKLFARLARHVALTEAGARLAPAVGQALDALAAAFAAARADAETVLTVTAAQSFATKWLAPRLGGLQLARPDLAIRLDVSTRLVDFEREEIDIGIRNGAGGWPGLAAHRLFAWRFAPYCSPGFARRERLAVPADLLRVARLSPDDAWWAAWFAAAGVDGARAIARPGLRLDSQIVEASAAIAGQGVAILSSWLWEREVAAGQLIRPFDIVGANGSYVWLVYPEAAAHRPKVRAFREWLLAEVAADAGTVT